jgi:hypothetical protein
MSVFGKICASIKQDNLQKAALEACFPCAATAMADSQPYAPGTRRRCCQGWVGNGNLIEQWRLFEGAGEVLELRIDLPARCPQMFISCISAGPFRTEPLAN